MVCIIFFLQLRTLVRAEFFNRFQGPNNLDEIDTNAWNIRPLNSGWQSANAVLVALKPLTEAGEKPKLADLLPTCFLFRPASTRRPDFLSIQRPGIFLTTPKRCKRMTWWPSINDTFTNDSFTVFLVLEALESVLERHCYRNKNVSEFVGEYFRCLGSKFCFLNNVSRGGKIDIDKKYVSATMFPSLPRALAFACFDSTINSTVKE